MNGTLNRSYIYNAERSVVYEEEPSMLLKNDFSELRLQVLSLKRKVDNHKIFYTDEYAPPFMHFIEKDKKIVQKMGKIYTRYNQDKPLVLFDKVKQFKCYQLDSEKKQFIKTQILDHEGENAEYLMKTMPAMFESVYIPMTKIGARFLIAGGLS
jgi:hypothetical protein